MIGFLERSVFSEKTLDQRNQHTFQLNDAMSYIHASVSLPLSLSVYISHSPTHLQVVLCLRLKERQIGTEGGKKLHFCFSNRCVCVCL